MSENQKSIISEIMQEYIEYDNEIKSIIIENYFTLPYLFKPEHNILKNGYVFFELE